MEMNLADSDYQQKLMEPGGIAELASQMETEADNIEEPTELEQEIEADAEDAVDSIVDEEETEEELEADDAEETEEEQEEIDPEKEKSMKHLRQQVKYEQEQRQRVESELMQIHQFLEQAAQQQQSDSTEDEDYEPLDPKQAKEVEDLKKQQQQFQTQVAFQNALQSAEAEAASKYTDFGDAYLHLTKQKANELAALHGIPAEQAQAHAFKFIQATAFNAFQRGANIGDTIYNLAKSTGFSGAKAVKYKGKGMNPKAIAKNKTITEKKVVKSGAVDDLSNASTLDLLKKMQEPGQQVPMAEFKKLLAKVQK